MEYAYFNTPDVLAKTIIANEIFLNEVCMATHITLEVAKEQIIDYSLYVGEKDLYPIKREQAYYGFHRWLRNTKRFEKKDTKQQPTKGGLII